MFSGMKYKGNYENGLKHGEGELTYSTGAVCPIKQWQRGILVEEKKYETINGFNVDSLYIANDEWANFLMASMLMINHKTSTIVDPTPYKKYSEKMKKPKASSPIDKKEEYQQADDTMLDLLPVVNVQSKHTNSSDDKMVIELRPDDQVYSKYADLDEVEAASKENLESEEWTNYKPKKFIPRNKKWFQSFMTKADYEVRPLKE